LENNNLTNSGKDVSGIVHLAKGLASNKDLVILNLNNCNMDDKCSEALLEAMKKKNKTLISLDIENNRNMNL